MSRSTKSIQALDNFEAAALTIEDLLSAEYEPLPVDEQDAARASQRLHRWIAISADGSWTDFSLRMARMNWTREHLLARLGGVRRREGVAAPAWLVAAHRVFDTLRTAPLQIHTSNVAFDPLIAPLVNDAEKSLRNEWASAAEELLLPDAFDGIIKHLRLRLSNLCELPFYESLLSWRRGLLSEAQAGNQHAIDELASASLEGFAAHMRHSGYAALFQARPVLLRLVGVLIDQWSASYRTFLTRLSRDRDQLSTLVPGLPRRARVRLVEWGLSDPHHGGYSVLRLKFESDAQVLYKPKDLRPDRLMSDLVAEIHRLGCPETFVVPKALVCDGYGWTEHIDRLDCTARDDVAQYFRLFGGWLAIFHTLSASDMHMENFIACGHSPVPVDFEMILQGLRQRPATVNADTEARWLAASQLESSVQSVGMLPSYVSAEDGTLISMGALEPSVYPVSRLVWTDINTPRMQLSSVIEHLSIDSNLPVWEGKVQHVEAFRDEFLAGFVDTAAFLTMHGAHLSRIIQSMPGKTRVRRVVRPTRFYYMLLRRLYDHRRMTDAISWSLEADFVARFYDWADSAESPWKLAASERRQLLELGIPHFAMAAASNVIHDDRGPVTRLHLDLGPDVTRRRLEMPVESVARYQCEVIRACLQMPQEVRIAAPVVAGLPLARAMHGTLMEQALIGERSMTWVGLTRIDHEVAAQLAPLGHDLYYGSSGIALFLAGMARAGGQHHASRHCSDVFGATIQTIESPRLAALQRAIGIGGAVGLGSVVYAFAAAGELLREPRWLQAAESCAGGINLEAIAADRRFDLVGGAAGACLALLALHRRIGAEWLIERAVACADHLLAHRDRNTGLWRVQPDFGPLTGTAHGAAGFALAFSRLHSATRHARFAAAAQDCVAFENAHFDDALGNWTDVRLPVDARGLRSPNQWCYGAAGIGLARLAMRGGGAVDDSVLAQDVDRAVAATLADPGGRNSTLCCGDAGHVDFLARAASALSRPELQVAAWLRCERLASMWTSNGDFKWNGGTAAANPGLFQGLAGVGWAALVAASSTSLPSILVLD